jgi:hypothetical protein
VKAHLRVKAREHALEIPGVEGIHPLAHEHIGRQRDGGSGHAQRLRSAARGATNRSAAGAASAAYNSPVGSVEANRLTGMPS